MWKTRFAAIFLLAAGVGIGYFVYISELGGVSNRFQFKLGLDLSGGTHLVYRADVSSIPEGEVTESMETLRDVIERRVNLFGVAEPIVQVEREGGVSEGNGYRLIVEIPGVTDVESAVKMIGETPVLEFMTLRSDEEVKAYQEAVERFQKAQQEGQEVTPDPILLEGPYQPTELTGRFLQKAALEFQQTTGKPYISLTFNDEGAELFAEITKANVGKPVAIFLDRHLGNFAPITEPIVQEEIAGGQAQITGDFEIDEARTIVRRLNSGALPVNELALLSTQTIGPILGNEALAAGIRAGIYGFIVIALFLILWYRLPGLVSVVALGMYVVLMLALFKLIPVTLTAAGIAGFILSIGMAVDANILIFARMKEELAAGRALTEAMREGFRRAWLSIRDSNISSIITAVILFWFGTSLIEGFALVFAIGVIVSMFSAITITRTLLLSIGVRKETKVTRFLFDSGFLPQKSAESGTAA